MTASDYPDAPPPCPRCGKPAAFCVCAGIAPLATKRALLILQHPQEQDRTLGTGRLTALHFRKAVLRVGLSWPSLSKALGRAAEPKRWAVLHLGSAKPATLAPGREIIALDRQGQPLPRQEAVLGAIDGVVLLDGSWSQAKTLWWRNPWLLKLQRLVLAPPRPSRYGKLRREPRREGLSTLEAAGLLLSRLEARPEIEAALEASFTRLLERYTAGPAPADPEMPETSAEIVR